MKIAIIGAGAMGSVYAGLLADAGNDVWVVDVWERHVSAIRERGLRVEGASGDRLVWNLNATTKASDVGQCDLVIIATKASGVCTAAQAIGPILGEQTLILTIQNGLGAGERISEYLPSDNILLGVAGGFGASIKGPGHVHHNGMELIRIGEMHGGLTPRVERVAGVWRDAGFNVGGYEDINQLIWEKFICNVTFSAPCTVLRCTVGELMDDSHAWKIGVSCALEAHAVARAKHIPLSFDDPERYITAFGSKISEARPSMLLDHLASRPSEIDAINGKVPVAAAEVGLQAPCNEVVTAIVKYREARF